MRKALILVAFAAVVSAQTSQPAFDAVSVKVNTGGTAPTRVATLPNRFSAVNATLRMLARYAFNVPDYRLSGGPNWMDADRFDIEGAAGRTAPFDEIRAMTRTALENRFKLRSHVEKRDQPIFILTVARRDGKLGEQMAPATDECKPLTPPKNFPPPPPPPPGGAPAGPPRCPSILSPFAISGRKLSMSQLVTTLSNSLNRHIVDQTNLTGTFDLDLHWLPDQLPQTPPGAPPMPIDPSWPPLSTALQEQLGLRLESSRGAVDVVVIDSVEKPSSD